MVSCQGASLHARLALLRKIFLVPSEICQPAAATSRSRLRRGFAKQIKDGKQASLSRLFLFCGGDEIRTRDTVARMQV